MSDTAAASTVSLGGLSTEEFLTLLPARPPAPGHRAGFPACPRPQNPTAILLGSHCREGSCSSGSLPRFEQPQPSPRIGCRSLGTTTRRPATPLQHLRSPTTLQACA